MQKNIPGGKYFFTALLSKISLCTFVFTHTVESVTLTH